MFSEVTNQLNLPSLIDVLVMGSATVSSSSMTPAPGEPNIHSASSQETVSCFSCEGVGEIPSVTLALKETPPVLQNHTHCHF